VTNKPRLRKSSGLTLVLLACLWNWSDARAEDVRKDTLAPLRLNLKDYETFVQKLAGEVDGNEAAMATRLRSLGFSCTPVSKSVAFECVRFGCQKRIIGPGSLLQWTCEQAGCSSREDGIPRRSSQLFVVGTLHRHERHRGCTAALPFLPRSKPL